MSTVMNSTEKLSFALQEQSSKEKSSEYCKGWGDLVLNLKEAIACDQATD